LIVGNKPRPTDSFSFDQVPGLSAVIAEARSRQNRAREDAWIERTFAADGEPLRIMRVCDYVLLHRCKSPLMCRIEPTIDELAAFLWVMHPKFDRRIKSSLPVRIYTAHLHGQRIGRRFGRNMPKSSERAVLDCIAFVDHMLEEAPAGVERGGDSPVCYLTYWFDAMMHQYNKTEDEVWEMPIPKLFSLLRAIERRTAGRAPAFCRAEDEVKSKLMRGLRNKQFTREDLIAGRVDVRKLLSNESN
jgi:hypothetical protein